MSETCYDWPVDGRPTQVRYTVSGDVTGSIKIGVDFKPTFTTLERGTITITFVDVPANRTLLRSVPGIDRDNLLTKILGFVPDKLLQLIKRPVVKFPVKLSTAPFLHADLSEVFKSEYRKWFLDYLLRDTVIYISHKPSFSTGQFTEFPFGGPSAFGLKLSSEICVLRPRILHRPGIKKCVIGTDCNVDNTPINAENRLFRDTLRGICFNLAMQIKHTVVLTDRQGRGFDFPCQIWTVIFRDTERGFNPTIGGRNGCVPGSQEHVYNPGVVSHCRIHFTERFKLTFNRFKSLTSNVSRALYQRGREIGNRLPDIVIGSIVAINLADRTGFKTPCRTDIKSHSIISHGFQERIAGIRRNIEFQLNCPNHIHILVVLDNILNGVDRSTRFLPNVNDGVSALLLR